MKYRNFARFLRRTTSLFVICTLFATMIIPTTIVYSASTPPKGVIVSVTDSSNVSIPTDSAIAGSSANKIITPVRLSADAFAHFSINLTNVTTEKYSFVKATDTTTVPAFPSDSNMLNLTLPPANTTTAYADDLGDQGYITTKHYIYQGKQNEAIGRTITFGTPVSGDDKVLKQKAKDAIDIYETDASTSTTTSAFLLDTSTSNKVYSVQSSADTVYTHKFVSGSTTYYMKNAGIKAMKAWGYFKPDKTGSYLLGAYSDDGAYGYIDIDGVEHVFVNDWRIAGPQFRCTPDGKDDNNTGNISVTGSATYKGVDLVGGNVYPIYMEWYEGMATQGAFVPQYVYNSTTGHAFTLGGTNGDATGIFNGSSATNYVVGSTTYQAGATPDSRYNGMHTIPSGEFYNSLTTTPEESSAYFGDLSGISMPSEDGIYYIAYKFKSSDSASYTQGLYGPFIVDNTPPTLNNLTVTTNNSYNNKYATNTTTATSITIGFTSSETLDSDPQLKINGTVITNASMTINNVPTGYFAWTKDSNNNYSATITMGTNINPSLITQGAISLNLDKYSDLSGNNGGSITDSTVMYDSIAPTVSLSYSSNPADAGTEIITAKYSEPISLTDTPKIGIDQPGSTDVTGAAMTLGADRTIWTYSYTVNTDNNGAYKDGTATVSLSPTHDYAGNISVNPTNNTFTICTTALMTRVDYTYQYLRAYSTSDPVVQTITVNYSKPIVAGETPYITIVPKGSAKIANAPVNVQMTKVSNQVWTYQFKATKANGSAYVDGDAQVKISNVHDAANPSKTDIQASEYVFTIDTANPTVYLTYSRVSPMNEGSVTISAIYSEPISDIPTITVTQQGIAVSVAVMTVVPATNNTVWTYNYTVNKDNGTTYKDGQATVSLSPTHDLAYNVSYPPNYNTFVIDTTPPTIVISSPSPSTISNGSSTSVTYNITYSGESNINLYETNIHIVKSGNFSQTIDIKGVYSTSDSDTMKVIVEGIGGSGTFHIVVDSGSANDTAGNMAPAASSLDVIVSNPVTGVNFSPPQYMRVNTTTTTSISVSPNTAYQGVTWSTSSSSTTVSSINSTTAQITAGGIRGPVDIKATSVGKDSSNNNLFTTATIIIIDPNISASFLVTDANGNPFTGTSKPAIFSKVKITPTVSFTDIDTTNPASISYQWSVQTKGTGSTKDVGDSSHSAYLTGSKTGNVVAKLLVTATAKDRSSVTQPFYVTVNFDSAPVDIG